MEGLQTARHDLATEQQWSRPVILKWIPEFLLKI